MCAIIDRYMTYNTGIAGLVFVEALCYEALAAMPSLYNAFAANFLSSDSTSAESHDPDCCESYFFDYIRTSCYGASIAGSKACEIST